MTALVSVERVSHSFGPAKVLDDVSLSIAAGSYTVLLGPSGSGKTTLLSILGGFLQPGHGRVLIRGEDCTAMAPAKRPTATVFQDYALFPHMSIGGNVGFGLRMKGIGRAARDAQARDMLGIVGLAAASTRSHINCRAASGSAWRWRGHWSSSRPCCCSMNHWGRSISSSAARCRTSSRPSRGASAPPSCM